MDDVRAEARLPQAAGHQFYDEVFTWLREHSKVSQRVLADVFTRIVVLAPEAVTRAEIARGLMLSKPDGLPPSSVTKAVAAMIKLGLVAEGVAAPQNRTGRPDRPVRLDGERWGLMGLKVITSDEHPTHISGVITKLDGTVVVRGDPEPHGEGEDLVESLARSAARLLARLAEQEPRRGGKARLLLGVGVDVAAPVDKGYLVSATHVGFGAGERVDLAGPLQARLEKPWPVVVDNDANLLAVYETYRPPYRERDLSVVSVFAEGIGAALVLDGRVYRGGAGKAGEVGHQFVALDADPPAHLGIGRDDLGSFGARCACGAESHVDSFATPARLAEGSGRDFASAARATALDDHGKLTRSGWVFQRGGEALGLAVASIVNVVNPSRVVLVVPRELADASLFGNTAASRYRRAVEQTLTSHGFATGPAEARAGGESLTIECLPTEDVAERGAICAAVRVLDMLVLHARGRDDCSQREWPMLSRK